MRFIAAAAAAAVALLTESVSGGQAPIAASLRFPRLKHTFHDTWPEFASVPGPVLKRWAKENGTVEHAPVNMEEATVSIRVADESDPAVHLAGMGFERVELHPRILPLLKHVKQHGLSGNRVGPTIQGNLFVGGGTDEEIEDKLARQLQGADSFSLGGGVRHYAFYCAGFVIRKGGPEGSALNGSGFDQVAQRVHIDQDLRGEPLLGMGLTWVFRLPFMYLLNVWSPLHDIRMRPMAFVDQRTVDPGRDVMRYRTNSTANAGGRRGSFQSDRLMSLHHASHAWYWFPDMRFGQAVAWNTGTVPHSSFSLPGEAVLTLLRRQLDAFAKGDRAAGCGAAAEADVKAAIAREADALSMDMEAQIGAAAAFVRRACDNHASADDVAYALEYLTRASLEIRCVTAVLPERAFQLSRAALATGFCLAGAWALARRWRK